MAAKTCSFSALSKQAQQAALDKYRDYYADHDWWDSTYEDVARMAACLGIDIETHSGKDQGTGPKIYFSGFWSQGDGASFVGWYNPKPDAIAAVQAECGDETLLDLAQRLTAINVAMALTPGFNRLHAKITTSGRYVHSGTMSVEVETDPSDIDFPEEFDKELTPCMREFADWIYEQLEAENEYLTSDETLKERFTEDGILFNEDGAII